jgi:hypothetical protein
MLIIFTFQLIQTIRILWFYHRSEMSPVWNKYVNQYSDGIVSFTLHITGERETEFYVSDKRQLMIIIMMPTVVFNARDVFEQQGLVRGDQSNNRFYTIRRQPWTPKEINQSMK